MKKKFREYYEDPELINISNILKKFLLVLVDTDKVDELEVTVSEFILLFLVLKLPVHWDITQKAWGVKLILVKDPIDNE